MFYSSESRLIDLMLCHYLLSKWLYTLRRLDSNRWYKYNCSAGPSNIELDETWRSKNCTEWARRNLWWRRIFDHWWLWWFRYWKMYFVRNWFKLQVSDPLLLSNTRKIRLRLDYKLYPARTNLERLSILSRPILSCWRFLLKKYSLFKSLTATQLKIRKNISWITAKLFDQK